MGPPDSRRVSRAPRYSGFRYAAAPLRVRGSHPLRPPVPGAFRSRRRVQCRGPTTPTGPRPGRFGLLPGRSPLLGESLLFSLPAGTEMFQFPALASATMRMAGRIPPGSPIRTPPDQRPLAPTRGFSQLVASFIACRSLGIRRAPFVTCSRTPTRGTRMTRLGPAPTGRGPPLLVSLLCVHHVKDPHPPAREGMWRMTESNRRPLACHASALAS